MNSRKRATTLVKMGQSPLILATSTFIKRRRREFLARIRRVRSQMTMMVSSMSKNQKFKRARGQLVKIQPRSHAKGNRQTRKRRRLIRNLERESKVPPLLLPPMSQMVKNSTYLEKMRRVSIRLLSRNQRKRKLVRLDRRSRGRNQREHWLKIKMIEFES